MKVRIQSDVVRKNIELFKHLAKRQVDQHATLPLQGYTAFVHRETGALRFIDEGKETVDASLWKPVRLKVRLKGLEDRQGVFELVGEEKREELFRYDDLLPAAYTVMKETLRALNQISAHLDPSRDLGKVWGEFAHLEIEVGGESKDLIYEAWHQVDRLGAEKLLERQLVGTFLFRKDEYAAILEEQLKQRFPFPVRCWTLTFLDEEFKVSDRTIVKKDRNWLFYNDDPTLSGHSYETAMELLESLKSKLRTPLIY